MLLFYFTIVSLGLGIIAVVLFEDRQNKLDFNHSRNAKKEEGEPSSDSEENTSEKRPEEQSPFERYKRLEILLEEKSKELEKALRALANELELRKEFTTLKDLLENQILELKRKNQALHFELNTTQIENESYHNKMIQLEDKLKGASEDLTIINA